MVGCWSDPHKAVGPDGISLRVVRELTTLFQASLVKAIVPSDCKKASVCSIYKKREKFVAANYIPVSLTCVTSTIMEHILTSQLMRLAQEKDIFHPYQHGIRRERPRM